MASPEQSRTNSDAGITHRLLASTSLRLALLAFVVFNLNLRSITSYDTYPTRLIPISILTHFSLDLDDFTFLREARFNPDADPAPHFMTYRRGHWMSTYPITAAILATPVYAIPVWLGLHRGPAMGGLARAEVVATLLSKIAASLAAALSVAFCFLTIRSYLPQRDAIGIALIYAFATSTWSVTSQGLWQTAFSQPALALALLALVRAREQESARWLAIAGTALALSVACRPPMVVMAVMLAAYVASQHRRQFLHFAAPAAVIGALLLTYNFYYFANLAGGYGGPLSGERSFAPPALLTGLQGLLISPNRGMLVFSPVLIPSFAGMWMVLTRPRDTRDELLVAVAVATLVTIVGYASSSVWHGAFGFSYRYLAEMLPAFALLLVPVWAWLVATRARRVAIGAVIAYSIAVQIVGCFYYPCGWYRKPANRDLADLSQYFSWSDMELSRCVRAGVVDPDGLRAIRRALGIRGAGREAR